jgi:hypothetical protein
MIIFWNFAGVPFVSIFLSLVCTYLTCAGLVVCLLRRLYGFPRPVDLSVFNCDIRGHVYNSPYRILHVGPRSVIAFSTVQPTSSRFDTSMSQKSRFKMQTQGIFKYRYTFPQLPWGTVKNPTYIQTAHGYAVRLSYVTLADVFFFDSNRLLTNGWWAYARKPARNCSSAHQHYL